MALVKEIIGSSSHVLDRSSPFTTSSSKILGLNKNLLLYPTNGKRFCVSCVDKGDSQSKKVVRTSPISAISDRIGRIVPEKPVKFKVRAVGTVKNKNKEDFKETIVKPLDAFTDKIGRNVVLELVSSDTDPRTGTPKKSKEAVLQTRLYHNSLDPLSEIPEQANGKAFIIGETTRMVKDMLKQIECLKKENEALLFESQYVTSENNELQVENSAMQDQIVKLQKELKERT